MFEQAFKNIDDVLWKDAGCTKFNMRLKGVGVPNLHLEEIREVRLAFPADLKAQDRVVDELDDLREETQRLASSTSGDWPRWRR